MNLILEIIKSPSVDIFQQTASFDSKGGKIGRNRNAKFVLNDPTKHISNFHAEISYKDGQYFITDISSNGMHLQNPPKKFIKGEPVALNQKSAVVIGDYLIGVKTIESGFSSPSPVADNSSTPPSAGLPDTFFVGDLYKESRDVIDPSAPEDKDVLSLLGKEASLSSGTSEMLLPDLDNIMGVYEDEAEMVMNDSLSTHIEPPTLESTEPPLPTQAQTVSTQDEDHLMKILALKLGVELDDMNLKEKENFVTHIAEIALTSLEQLRNTQRALAKIQQQLGVNTSLGKTAFNPLKTAPDNKEILSNLQSYSPSIAQHMKDIFHEIDIHTIAFHTAFKNISLRTAQKFSPEKLYFHFEKKNALNKSFTNKKALAWEAYCETFQHLDTIDKNEIDLSELQKEYNTLLETLTLGYNT